MLATQLAQKLHGPIGWTQHAPEIDAFLDRLQGNILKGHGRNNVAFMFCRFLPTKTAEAREFLKSQVTRVKPASDQLKAAAAFKQDPAKKDTRPFVCIFLTKAGYDYFGVPVGKQPADPAFQRGMPASHADLNDPDPATWDSHLRDPHLMILAAVQSLDQAERESTDLLNALSSIADIEGGRTGELIGNQFFNEHGEGIENFGYVDGRSQPLVLTEDLADEKNIDVWPVTQFPVDQFVVPDIAANDPAAYGSYYVFRQLEQDVAGFKGREDAINVGFDKDDLPFPKPFENRDSASVGRLESGTPYELVHMDEAAGPYITNNFKFDSDPPRCPHFSHIRKMNPRTDATRGNLMIRRGMTYGSRSDAQPDPADPSKLVIKDSKDPLPSGGVGLLFQSYQADIAKQFETTQKWANSPTGGVDPVIGQATSALLDWPTKYATNLTEQTDFYRRGDALPHGSYVKLRGGGYFFAPSLPFLRSL